MRTQGRLLCAASILLASILAFSCDNSYGVYKGVQGEKSQKGTTSFTKTQVSNAFRLGSNYYAATMTLNSKAVGDSVWSTVAIAGTTDYRLQSAVLAGDSSAGTIYALVETGGTVNVYRSVDGATWTADLTLPAQTYSGTSAFIFDALFSANGSLYAEGHAYDSTGASSASTYTLWYLNGTSFVHVNAFSPAADKPLRGVVFGAGSYYFASADLLFNGSAADGSDAASAITAYTDLSGKTISGISYTKGISTAGALYVATSDGYLYQGGNATGSSVASVPLTVVVQVPASATSDLILAGTDAIGTTPAVGYYEGTFGSLAIGSTNTQVALTASIFKSTVSTFPIHAFFYDPVKTTVFVCVSPGSSSSTYHGLYSSVWDPATAKWSGWSAE